MLIACCDGLTGLPEATEATFPHTTVQTCVVHLIRASMRFVSYKDRKKLAAALNPIYTAATVDAAETALLELADSDLGQRNKAPWPPGRTPGSGSSLPRLPARAGELEHHERRERPGAPRVVGHEVLAVGGS